VENAKGSVYHLPTTQPATTAIPQEKCIINAYAVTQGKLECRDKKNNQAKLKYEYKQYFVFVKYLLC
jgi:hypothetical protein